MIGDIIATGEEIITGALVDSNSAWLAERLFNMGVRIRRINAVGDDIDALSRLFEDVSHQADVALVTGGLGPTVDDLSAAAVAKTAGTGLKLDEGALKSVLAFFEKRNRPMPETNRKQAVLPIGAEPLDNPIGTAPGFKIVVGQCTFYFMPGVPPEMKRMFREQVRPRILQGMGSGARVSRQRVLCLFGLPESATDQKIRSFPELFPDIRLGLRAKFPEIQVKLYAAGADPSALDERLDAASRWVAQLLGDVVFSCRGESMETVIGQLLRSRSATLALAESCTGGLIASRITDVAGSSDYFLFSAVTYGNAAKVGVLGVSDETIARHGAVSEETAAEMAAGARRVAGATYGLSVSGIAGPSGGSAEKPVGTVCIGLATPEGVSTCRAILQFQSRAMNKQMFAMKALDVLRRELSGLGRF